MTEANHVTSVKAGENDGATLKHDVVVRGYKPVAAWSDKVGSPTTLRFTLSALSDPSHTRQVNLVVVDADTGRPVQALKLGC